MKPVWRVVTFVFTLLFIYLLFPILIVPSSLPAIQQMVTGQADAEIFELKGEAIPTLQDRFKDLQRRHRQGMNIILQR